METTPNPTPPQPVRTMNINQIMDAIPHRFPFLLIARQDDDLVVRVGPFQGPSLQGSMRCRHACSGYSGMSLGGVPRCLRTTDASVAASLKRLAPRRGTWPGVDGAAAKVFDRASVHVCFPAIGGQG